jgi:catechol 2,3-dioxygenase-like lactoylglutathione lyase family enzyme
MTMLHHVSVGVRDVARAAQFYDAVLATLGYKRVMEFLPYAVAYGDKNPEFWVQLPSDRNPASVGNGVHIGFAARSKVAIHAFHRAALGAGGGNEGDPGPRPDYGPAYYGAFVRDVDGNKLEAVLAAEPTAAKAPVAKARKAKSKAKATRGGKRGAGPKKKRSAKAK